ncbi:MAG: DUF4846 domain-containing protein [Bacteroidota bacterium]
MQPTSLLFLLCVVWANVLMAQQPPYHWLDIVSPGQALAQRIPPPAGYERVPAKAGSFADWLRNIPLKPGNPEVRLYNGQLKGNQSAQHSVTDLDVGKRDLQQCADATMRLRAEYLLSCGAYEQIHFNFTSGDEAAYAKWKAGYRPKISGNRVNWVRSAQPNDSYASFRKYLETVYMYAGTYSLQQEMKPIPIEELQAGDVFIQGGFPGHAVMVMDVVRHPETGIKRFLLAQSYMPAQDMHILRNPTDASLSPWYELPAGSLYTPEWTFEAGDLRRF